MRVRRTVAIMLASIAMIWFVGGFVLFPDMPIHPCGVGYCGKQGQPRTALDFERYRIWDAVSMWGGLILVVGAWWLMPKSPRNPYEERNEQVRSGHRRERT